jgi:Transposase, Mutator family
MADRPRMTADQLVDKLLADEHADVLCESIAWLVAELMDAEVATLVGAELGERAPDRRTTQRNGYRPRDWDTRVGSIELAIPKLRSGSYFPSFLEPRRRAEQALVAVVQEAYVNGVSTGKVDRLVAQLGLQGMTNDQVSRLCGGLDGQVRVFRERPLEGAYPYLWLDAKVERVREPGGVRHKALVIADGVHHSGRREVLGLDVGQAETEACWREFLRSLRARGLDGVKLAITDAHAGSSRRSPRCWAARGSAAPSTSCATRSATSPGPSSRWSPARSAAASPPPRPLRHGSGSAGSSTSCACTPPRSRGCWRRRGRPAGLLRVPGRASGQAALHQPLGAGQPRGRPALGCGGDLPQRRRAAAPGRDAAARAER